MVTTPFFLIIFFSFHRQTSFFFFFFFLCPYFFHAPLSSCAIKMPFLSFVVIIILGSEGGQSLHGDYYDVVEK